MNAHVSINKKGGRESYLGKGSLEDRPLTGDKKPSSLSLPSLHAALDTPLLTFHSAWSSIASTVNRDRQVALSYQYNKGQQHAVLNHVLYSVTCVQSPLLGHKKQSL